MSYEYAALSLGEDREAHRIALWLWRTGLSEPGSASQAPEEERPGRLAAARYLAIRLGCATLEELAESAKRISAYDDC